MRPTPRVCGRSLRAIAGLPRIVVRAQVLTEARRIAVWCVSPRQPLASIARAMRSADAVAFVEATERVGGQCVMRASRASLRLLRQSHRFAQVRQHRRLQPRRAGTRRQATSSTIPPPAQRSFERVVRDGVSTLLMPYKRALTYAATSHQRSPPLRATAISATSARRKRCKRQIVRRRASRVPRRGSPPAARRDTQRVLNTAASSRASRSLRFVSSLIAPPNERSCGRARGAASHSRLAFDSRSGRRSRTRQSPSTRSPSSPALRSVVLARVARRHDTQAQVVAVLRAPRATSAERPVLQPPAAYCWFPSLYGVRATPDGDLHLASA